ncbi:MAG: tetratricopeptide repeat protein [Bacteroidota bacterium]
MRTIVSLLAYTSVLNAFGQESLSLILAAENQLLEGDTIKAIATYKSVLEDFPESYSATKRLSEVYYYQQDYHNAILYSNITIEIAQAHFYDENKPDNKMQYKTDLADAHHLKGLIRLQQRRFRDALKELEVATRFDPLNKAVILDRAMVFFTANKLDSARFYLHSVKSKPEMRSKALFSLGNSYYKEKNLDSALFYYEQVTHSYPLFKTAYRYKGMVLTTLQSYRGAVEAFSTYLKLDSLSEEVLFRRAVLYNELGEMSNALQDWTRVIQLNDQNEEAYRNRGLTYFQAGSFNKAIEDFDQALELQPEQAYTEINRGYSYYLLNNPKQALTDLNHGIEKMPRYYFGYYFRSLVHLRLKNKKQACKDAKRAAELGMQESAMDDLVLKKCF